MENIDDHIEEPIQPKLVVTEEMRSHIYEIAKWASFLSIVGFVATGIIAIGAFTVGAAMRANPSTAAMATEMGAAGNVFFTTIALLWALAIFYPSLLMFKYAAKAKLGVLYGEQGSLNEAFSKLKSAFKYWGIVTLILVSLYLLAIISTMMGGVAAA